MRIRIETRLIKLVGKLGNPLASSHKPFHVAGDRFLAELSGHLSVCRWICPFSKDNKWCFLTAQAALKLGLMTDIGSNCKADGM